MARMKKTTPEKWKDLEIGQKVTARISIEAYYSGYGPNPKQFFQPGMIGTVGAVKCPKVMEPRSKKNWSPFFACVDFVADGKKWRCGMDLKDIVCVFDTSGPKERHHGKSHL